MKTGKLNSLPEFLRKLSVRAALFRYPRYQPVLFSGKEYTGNDRDCERRWQTIRKEIIASDSKNVLDLGSAEGFFVLKSAEELKTFSLGIDFDFRRQFFAVNQMLEQKPMGAGFVSAKITPEFLEKLPAFDAVIFLSIMHHIISEKGLDYGKELMKKIREKTKKILFFEMGQSDENMPWAKHLPDMGDNPHQWIKDFLQSSGFSKIRKIDESSGYSKDRKRAIFLAEP
ncbi:MAG: hypothetical protein A3A02_04235 [Candidatus Buchananbacteria bacterium RIFCSPLOWO2_01_FULL_39_33]|uniref:Methyltransferase domain-containing protein n=1 Tax=Candidatus Buchananbacteria bacterium RIFCSPLOWO2_01_FULL_39_33 TaxID=1797543 RepID=A0A1G1YJR0_9BACT|nr:MAG: hypothetical protein A3A02_04235 [Candidatus Buchananbacteria bacterium RIFCSPLOWO2_01_FULL_39_33]